MSAASTTVESRLQRIVLGLADMATKHDKPRKVLDNADAAQYAWALWFYRFDADNWFSYDRIREVINQYLSTSWNEDMQLVLVKGFQGRPLWNSGVSDMPVTLTEAEQTISLWRTELWD